MINIYYGMCGTFKLTTINNSYNYKFSEKIYSLIKPYYDLRSDVFKGLSSCNDLTLANIRLLRLNHLINSNNLSIVIERGITDFIHCYNSREINEKLPEDIIKGIVSKETEILEGLPASLKEYGKPQVRKILMIMNDHKFIQNVILKEPHRLETYKNLENYLKCQEDYIDFTKKYNHIDETIDIPNAQEYLKTLGLDYEED